MITVLGVSAFESIHGEQAMPILMIPCFALAGLVLIGVLPVAALLFETRKPSPLPGRAQRASPRPSRRPETQVSPRPGNACALRTTSQSGRLKR